ncbi:hypothetical protein, partial [Citrobacter braakii]|uniref:hypothetical protein n=1 Tax=Citrobacter braakii TaxID=57706 RepID=UPI0021651AF8
LKKTSDRVTTGEGIRVGKAGLKSEGRGRGKVIAALTSEQGTVQLVGRTLKAEQQKSVVDICTTTDRVVAAHGVAGTGKS